MTNAAGTTHRDKPGRSFPTRSGPPPHDDEGIRLYVLDEVEYQASRCEDRATDLGG